MENDEINLLKKIISLSKNKKPKDPFIHEKLIEKVEKEYKIKFPKDYRKFLLKNNVSEINESVFLTDLKIIHVLPISEIYSVSEVESYLEEIKKNDDLTYLEKKMIIIGHSNIELNLTICYKGKNKGKVFLCVDGDFYFLANSFDEFINNLLLQYHNSFQEAIEKGDYTKARKIIKNGFDLNTKNYYSETVIDVAIQYGLEDIVEKCLENNVETRNLVSKALSAGAEILKLILDKGFDVNERDEEGKTPIFNIIKCGKKEIIEILIDYGAEINIKDYSGNFLIHYAALAKPEILKLLVENNINIEVENYNDLRPIDLITKDSYPENYQLLKSLMINYDDEIKKESFAETFRRLGL